MKPIAIFYHAVLSIEGRELPQSIPIIREQMKALEDSGLLDAADQLQVGINGGTEGQLPGMLIVPVFLPAKSTLTYHSQQCRNELRTLLMLEKFVKDHGDEWMVLYFHAKGCTHAPETDYAKFAGRWRRCMMKHCVENWKTAVAALEDGYEAVGAHWLTGMGHDKSQHYFAGNFLWARNSFLKTLPSVMERERIKISGIDSLESRYESEVWIGNGPRLPKFKDLETTHGFAQCP